MALLLLASTVCAEPDALLSDGYENGQAEGINGKALLCKDEYTLPTYELKSPVGDAFTLMQWIKIDYYPDDGKGKYDDGSPMTLAELRKDPGAHRIIFRLNKKKAELTIRHEERWINFTGTTNLEPGLWYHLTVVCDGDAYQIYLNGRLDVSGRLKMQDIPWERLTIAGTYRGKTRLFRGIIDELRLFNLVLDEKAIMDVIRSSSNQPPGPDASAQPLIDQTKVNSATPSDHFLDHPIKITNTPGPLYGRHVLKNRLLGYAYIYNKKQPDLFMHSHSISIRGVRVPLEQRLDTIWIYPWLRDINGIPVFGEPVECAHDMPYDYVPRMILTNDDNTIDLIWAGQRELQFTRLDLERKRFDRTHTIGLKNLGKQMGNAAAMTLMPTSSGLLELVYAVRTGDDYHGKEFVASGFHQRGPFVDFYDGAGFWRGDLGKAHLRTATLSTISGAISYKDRSVSTEVISSFGHTLSMMNYGPGRERDILAGGQYGNTRYFHNKAKDGIDLEPMRHVVGSDGNILRNPTIDSSPMAYPNAITGMNSDFMSKAESWVYYYRFTGQFTNDGDPIYHDPVPVLQDNADLNLETLAVVNLVDWDGDGLLDIVSGNSPGYVLLTKNVGTADKPLFTFPTNITCHGRPIHRQPGYAGSVQGPLEARWGYSAPRVVDWNGDGTLDILLSGSPQTHEVYINRGTPREAKLDLPRPLYWDGLDLFGTWRVQPGAAKINGRMAYVILDKDDDFHLYLRIDDYNLDDGGKLTLSDGTAINANLHSAGGSGRAKITLADWDGDGLMDMLIGTITTHNIPTKKIGFPSSLPNPGAAVLLMRNIGTQDKPMFDWPQLLHRDGEIAYFGVHSCSVAVGDLNNDGKNDLIVGDENGYVYYFTNSQADFRTIDTSAMVVQCRWQDGLRQGAWHHEINWWRGVPRDKDRAIIHQNAVIDLSQTSARCLDLMITNHSQVLLRNIKELDVFNTIRVGTAANHQSSLTLEDGQVSVAGDVQVGVRGSASKLIISGTNLIAQSISISQQSNVLIKSGTLSLAGDARSSMDELIKDNLIKAYDIDKKIHVQYDSSAQRTVISD